MTSAKEHDLIDEFVRSGWTVLDPERASSQIDFIPDHLLRKGDDYLVVQIEQAGRKPERSVAEMRRAVERHPHWRFALKLRPPLGPNGPGEIEEAQERLSIVRRLLDDGHRTEAVLIAWVAIESSLRRLIRGDIGQQADPPLPTLVRRAYEADVISEAELRLIDRARALRTRIVHGFKARVGPDDAERIVSLARSLSERAEREHTNLVIAEAH